MAIENASGNTTTRAGCDRTLNTNFSSPQTSRGSLPGVRKTTPEVQSWQRKHVDIPFLVSPSKQHAHNKQFDGQRSQSVNIPQLGRSASSHPKHEIEWMPHMLNGKEESNKRLKKMCPQEQARRHEEVFAVIEAEVKKRSEEQTATADLIRELQQRIDELVANLSTRVVRLEDTSNLHCLTEERVAGVLSSLQGQQQQVTRVLEEHQSKLQSLSSAASAWNMSGAMTVRKDQASCMRLLHGDLEANRSLSARQHLHQDGGNARESLGILLKELQEEHESVSKTLNQVRQEKAEVIATMHIFNLNKSKALQEMVKVRREVQNDLTACGLTRSRSAKHVPHHDLVLPTAMISHGEAPINVEVLSTTNDSLDDETDSILVRGSYGEKSIARKIAGDHHIGP